MEEIIGEIFLDQVALIAQANDEIIDPRGAVNLHDVPQDRHSADLDHRLRPHICLLRETRAEPAGQDDSLHERPRRTAPVLNSQQALDMGWPCPSYAVGLTVSLRIGGVNNRQKRGMTDHTHHGGLAIAWPIETLTRSAGQQRVFAVSSA